VIQKAEMTLSGNEYKSMIPGPCEPGDHFSYRIQAEDAIGNIGCYPGPLATKFRTFDISVPLEGLWECFEKESHPFDLSNKRLNFSYDPLEAHRYQSCIEEFTDWTIEPEKGEELILGNDAFIPIELKKGSIPLYGEYYDKIYVGSNGYISFIQGDTFHEPTKSHHFLLPRISVALADINPLQGGKIIFEELSDRAVISYLEIKQTDNPGTNTFQLELFYHGLIRLSYLEMAIEECLVGLSNGQGIPGGNPVDLSLTGLCLASTPPEVILESPSGEQTGLFLVHYKLYDEEGDSADIHVQYSQDGGTTWRRATEGFGGEGDRGLSSSPEGTQHIYSWNCLADFGSGYFPLAMIQITPYRFPECGMPGHTEPFEVYNPMRQEIQNYLLSQSLPLQINLTRLDVNKDGIVDIADILMTIIHIN